MSESTSTYRATCSNCPYWNEIDHGYTPPNREGWCHFAEVANHKITEPDYWCGRHPHFVIPEREREDPEGPRCEELMYSTKKSGYVVCLLPHGHIGVHGWEDPSS